MLLMALESVTPMTLPSAKESLQPGTQKQKPYKWTKKIPLGHRLRLGYRVFSAVLCDCQDIDCTGLPHKQSKLQSV